MIGSLYKANREILQELKNHYMSSTKRITDKIADLSIDISQLNISDACKTLLGPSLIYLNKKGFIDLENRRVTITPKGIEELEPIYFRYRHQLFLAVFSGILGILGTIIGVVLTLIYSK